MRSYTLSITLFVTLTTCLTVSAANISACKALFKEGLSKSAILRNDIEDIENKISEAKEELEELEESREEIGLNLDDIEFGLDMTSAQSNDLHNRSRLQDEYQVADADLSNVHEEIVRVEEKIETLTGKRDELQYQEKKASIKENLQDQLRDEEKSLKASQEKMKVLSGKIKIAEKSHEKLRKQNAKSSQQSKANGRVHLLEIKYRFLKDGANFSKEKVATLKRQIANPELAPPVVGKQAVLARKIFKGFEAEIVKKERRLVKLSRILVNVKVKVAQADESGRFGSITPAMMKLYDKLDKEISKLSIEIRDMRGQLLNTLP